MDLIKFKTTRFKPDTYVYIEDQPDSAEFYIVRQGILIEENPLNLLTGEADTIIKAGDFFGVLDCMSRRPRLSSIRVIEETILITVRFGQFEALITQMAPIAMKVIRFCSRQLRKYNATILSVSKDSFSPKSSPTQLVVLGDFYKDQRSSKMAGYAYTKFLEACPEDPECRRVKEDLASLNYDHRSVQPIQQGIQLSYNPGSPIFLEHEEGSDLYIVLNGFVKITKVIDDNEVLIGMVTEKDIFGEMAILENSPRSASAVATSKVTLLKINKQNFELYIRSHPEIARRIIQLLAERIWLVFKRLSNQFIPDPVTRIYDSLNTLIQKDRVPIQKGVPYIFDMSPEEIIQFVGFEPAIGKRHLQQLITYDPLMAIENGKLVSKDITNIRSGISTSNRGQTMQPYKK